MLIFTTGYSSELQHPAHWGKAPGSGIQQSMNTIQYLCIVQACSKEQQLHRYIYIDFTIQ
jgi:hypothetical protein